MSTASFRSDTHKPCVSKVFTTFAAAQVLHEDSVHLATGAAPDGIRRMPTALFVVASAADVLIWKDSQGASSTLTFTAAYTGPLPFTAASVETSTTVKALVVSWNK